MRRKLENALRNEREDQNVSSVAISHICCILLGTPCKRTAVAQMPEPRHDASLNEIKAGSWISGQISSFACWRKSRCFFPFMPKNTGTQESVICPPLIKSCAYLTICN